jgi:hypothetical protein
MDLSDFIQQTLSLVSDFPMQAALTLFLICFISESLGFSIPLVLESFWLLAGCQLRLGALGLIPLIGLWSAAQAGRQLGAYLFYLLSRVTVGPLLRLSRFVTGRRFMDRSAGLLNRLNFESPFAVALGRLLYLRVPITMIIGARRQPGTLALGVLISSMVFDGAWLAIGVSSGSTVTVNPWILLVILLAGLGAMYLAFYLLRLTTRRILDSRTSQPGTKQGIN